MAKSIKILGVVILLLGYLAYAISWFNTNEQYNHLYWLPSMTGISLLLFGVGKDEINIRLKHLVYYPVGWFFASLSIFYTIDKYLDFVIDVNKVILSLIISTTICLLLFFYKKLRP